MFYLIKKYVILKQVCAQLQMKFVKKKFLIFFLILNSNLKDFIRGQGKIGNENREIIVTDTIGLCDTELKDEHITDLLKDRISSNMYSLNKIFVVISSARMHKNHLNNIKKMMDWLDYSNNYGRFYFVLTYCENASDEEKEDLKSQLAKFLNLKGKKYYSGKEFLYEKLPIDCVSFLKPELLNDYGTEQIKNSVLTIKEEIKFSADSFRIKKESSPCSIL